MEKDLQALRSGAHRPEIVVVGDVGRDQAENVADEIEVEERERLRGEEQRERERETRLMKLKIGMFFFIGLLGTKSWDQIFVNFEAQINMVIKHEIKAGISVGKWKEIGRGTEKRSLESDGMLRGPTTAAGMINCPRAAASASLRDSTLRTMDHSKTVTQAQAQEQDKLYFQYNHTVPSKFARWTTRQSHEFMYDRPWQHVNDLYSKLVKGHQSLSALLGTETYSVPDDTEISEVILDVTELEHIKAKDRFGRWARSNFKIVLSYHGGSFDGWQKQPDLSTVQGFVERSLGRFVDDKKAQSLKEKCKPLEGPAFVAGRTDKGVSALRQVCSFYTWREDVNAYDIENAINLAAPGKLRVVSVSVVPRSFHPNFSAKWRRYIYFFPLSDGENEEESGENEEDAEEFHSTETLGEMSNRCVEDEFEGKKVPRRFRVSKVNQLLQQLEGKLLSYRIFARDTKASRSIGPPTECFIYHARAAVVRLPCSDCERGKEVMCVELVANRFLRRMVRVLVATSIREAAAVAEDDALLKLMDATCRRATATPAPPDGLCLADVGYADFTPQNRLIP